MGVQDIVQLHTVLNKIKFLEKENNWGFSFNVDDGYYETALIFNEEKVGYRVPGPTENWESLKFPEAMICPDLLDLEHKIILEYEEETGRRLPGAKLAKKGHGKPGDPATNRDDRRNSFYVKNKFRFCRVWESQMVDEDLEWKLFHFLADCYCNRHTMKYQY